MLLIFGVLMLVVFCEMLGVALRATWGIMKVFCMLIFCPMLLIALAFGGLFIIAIPVLLMMGTFSLFWLFV